jgi:hypothetical protein
MRQKLYPAHIPRDVPMKVGGNIYGLTQSADEQVRLRACQWWTARRMGWKETIDPAAFGNAAYFSCASFGDVADFSGAKFGGAADFSGAAFGAVASFCDTFFEKTTTFTAKPTFTGKSKEEWSKDFEERAKHAGEKGIRLVYRGEESGFEFLEAGRSYAFDADGGLLRLASEAYRIRLAYLFDPYLAVSASQIEAPDRWSRSSGADSMFAGGQPFTACSSLLKRAMYPCDGRARPGSATLARAGLW